MNRIINKVAVLGSGVMGSRIACHFANIGVEVLLLDIVPRELNEQEKAKGKTLEDAAVRNRLVNEALQFAAKAKPSPLYLKKFLSRITTGNLEDDLVGIGNCDWIIEVVIERLDIKQKVFESVEKHRKPGTLITSNTSGIPIASMLDGRSDDFKKHFCGTHFFNPPRYLKLLELIPTKETDPAVIDFLTDYGVRFLGKDTVLCKDTPAFIANRVGVYSILSLFHLIQEMDLGVDTIDKLTGTILGRPKSATFRTCDVVGLDTLVHVANGLKANCPNDEAKALFEIPAYIQKMLDNNWLGSKTKQGFYNKIKNAEGKSEILELDLKTLEYRSKVKAKLATVTAGKAEDDLHKRMKILIQGKDEAGEFYRRSFFALFAYVSNRIPEISDELYRIDDALRAGFGWELGPFEAWDAIGLEKSLAGMADAKAEPAAWVTEMIAAKATTFYKIENGVRSFYDAASKGYKPIPESKSTINLAAIRSSKTVWKNASSTVTDLGDGILNLEWKTKMNTIGGDVIEGINKAISIAEESYSGLVISNDGENFSAGANVGLIFMMAAEQEYGDLEFAIRTFQNTMMRVRYSSIPVIAAPHGLCLGGGCELSLHADKVIAHAETYMGLVEFGVGLIPGGGGSKEFALRISDQIQDGDIRLNRLRNSFLTIGQAKVSTSGHEAFDLGYLQHGKDEIIVSRKSQLSYAKKAVLQMAEKGYTKPVERTDITVLGKEGLGIIYAGANSMRSGNYMSDHDQVISEKLGIVLCGGDLSETSVVSEQYLLNLERKAFLELCQTKKTLERLQSLVQSGKILRN